MRYLIDTNILLFVVRERDRLASEVADILSDTSNLIYVSSKSVEEIVLLLRGGQIEVPRWKSVEDVFRNIDDLGFTVDYFKREHIVTFGGIVPAFGHKDPFDHAIIAHAITNRMTLVSSDSKFPFYVRQGLELILNRV